MIALYSYITVLILTLDRSTVVLTAPRSLIWLGNRNFGVVLTTSSKADTIETTTIATKNNLDRLYFERVIIDDETGDDSYSKHNARAMSLIADDKPLKQQLEQRIEGVFGTSATIIRRDEQLDRLETTTPTTTITVAINSVGCVDDEDDEDEDLQENGSGEIQSNNLDGSAGNETISSDTVAGETSSEGVSSANNNSSIETQATALPGSVSSSTTTSTTIDEDFNNIIAASTVSRGYKLNSIKTLTKASLLFALIFFFL